MEYKVGQNVRYRVKDEGESPQYNKKHREFLEKNNYVVTIRVVDKETSTFTVKGFDGWWGTGGIIRIEPEPEPM